MKIATRAAAAVLIAGLGVAGFAGPASASVHDVWSNCEGLTISFLGYAAGSSVVTTQDGVAAAPVTFGEGVADGDYASTLPYPTEAATHTWSVVVTSVNQDGSTSYGAFSDAGEVTGCTPPFVPVSAPVAALISSACSAAGAIDEVTFGLDNTGSNIVSTFLVTATSGTGVVKSVPWDVPPGRSVTRSVWLDEGLGGWTAVLVSGQAVLESAAITDICPVAVPAAEVAAVVDPPAAVPVSDVVVAAVPVESVSQVVTASDGPQLAETGPNDGLLAALAAVGLGLVLAGTKALRVARKGLRA